MTKRVTTTTPDPELSPPIASGDEDSADAPDTEDPAQAQQPQQPGGGGAPGTGNSESPGGAGVERSR